jgi:amphi-Trp domain-containing protein
MTKQKPTEKAATQTPAPPEATATVEAPTEAPVEAKAEDDEEKDDDEKDDDEKDDDEKDDDEKDDDEKKSKKKKKKKKDDEKDDEADKPKKLKIDFEATLPRHEAISYFEAIVAGLRSGRLEFKQGDQALVLSPPDRLEIEVKAQSKGDKGRVVFEIAWSDEHRALDISS